MGVEEGGRLIYKDVLPFAGMLMIEFMLVAGNTLYKSASVEPINSYVFTFYVFLIGFIFLLPCLFVLHRRTSIPPIKFSVAGKIFALSVLISAKIKSKFLSDKSEKELAIRSATFLVTIVVFLQVLAVTERIRNSDLNVESIATVNQILILCIGTSEIVSATGSLSEKMTRSVLRGRTGGGSCKWSV